MAKPSSSDETRKSCAAVQKSQKVLSDLLSDNQQLCGRVHELDETLRAMRNAYAAENEKLKEDIVDLEERNETLKAENLELVVAATSDQDAQKLQEENFRLVRESLDSLVEIDRLLSEVKHADEGLKKLRTKNQELSGKLESGRSTNAEALKKLEALQKERSQLQAEIAKHSERGDSAEVIRMRTKNEALREQNELLRTENEALTQELRTLHREASRVQSLEKELEEAREQLRIFQGQKPDGKPLSSQAVPFGEYTGTRPLSFGELTPSSKAKQFLSFALARSSIPQTNTSGLTTAPTPTPGTDSAHSSGSTSPIMTPISSPPQIPVDAKTGSGASASSVPKNGPRVLFGSMTQPSDHPFSISSSGSNTGSNVAPGKIPSIFAARVSADATGVDQKSAATGSLAFDAIQKAAAQRQGMKQFEINPTPNDPPASKWGACYIPELSESINSINRTLLEEKKRLQRENHKLTEEVKVLRPMADRACILQKQLDEVKAQLRGIQQQRSFGKALLPVFGETTKFGEEATKTRP